MIAAPDFEGGLFDIRSSRQLAELVRLGAGCRHDRPGTSTKRDSQC